MRSSLALILLASLSSLTIACSGGGECEKAFDKEIECSENPEEAREEAKKFRKMAIAACNAAKDDPAMKAAIKCSKKSTCDEFRACELQARAGEDVEELEGMLSAGKPMDAMQQCSYSIESYQAVPEIKAVCDKAVTAVFADLSDKEMRSDAVYRCTLGSDVKEWMAASAPLKAGCNALLADFQAQVTKQRDEGSEYDYSTCSSYKDLAKALTPDKEAAAELLCNEADQADDYAKAFAEATKNIAEKKTDVPYECQSFLGDKDEFKGSEWYAAKSKELAKLCYGDLGKIVLAGVSSYCLTDAKNVHKYAAEYSLAEGDAALTELLAKTAPECTKE